jgi:aminoglycoside 3-N-acetyltransferase
MIDVDYKKSATYVHYVEEKVGVEYRFMKDFTAGYIDSDGVFSNRTYSMYVRHLDKEVDVTINPMHEIFAANGAVAESEYNGREIRLIDMRKAYDLVEQYIVENSSRRITKYWGN